MDCIMHCVPYPAQLLLGSRTYTVAEIASLLSVDVVAGGIYVSAVQGIQKSTFSIKQDVSDGLYTGQADCFGTRWYNYQGVLLRGCKGDKKRAHMNAASSPPDTTVDLRAVVVLSASVRASRSSQYELRCSHCSVARYENGYGFRYSPLGNSAYSSYWCTPCYGYWERWRIPRPATLIRKLNTPKPAYCRMCGVLTDEVREWSWIDGLM